MPKFGKKLTGAQIALLVTYLRRIDSHRGRPFAPNPSKGWPTTLVVSYCGVAREAELFASSILKHEIVDHDRARNRRTGSAVCCHANGGELL
jgi:hypothetical protein